MPTINHVIIHKLIKEKHGKSELIPRDEDLQVTAPVEKLLWDIHGLYTGNPSKGFGRFEENEDIYPAVRIFRKVFVEQTLLFAQASKDLLSVLANKADSAPLSTGGYVLMAQVTNDSNESWFIVAIINNIAGSAIDDQTLEIVDAVHVDLKNLRVAGRVSITDWLGDDLDKRYVGFLKQRGDVAEYFKQFLGCNELVVSAQETKKLVSTLKQFAKDQNFDSRQEAGFLQSAYDYCLERHKNDEQLSLEALANAIWPDNPTELQETFATSDVQISNGFVPDGRSIKSLTKMKYKTKFWSIELDFHAITEGYARYSNGELVLTNLPDELKAELDYEIDDGS